MPRRPSSSAYIRTDVSIKRSTWVRAKHRAVDLGISTSDFVRRAVEQLLCETDPARKTSDSGSGSPD